MRYLTKISRTHSLFFQARQFTTSSGHMLDVAQKSFPSELNAKHSLLIQTLKRADSRMGLRFAQNYLANLPQDVDPKERLTLVTDVIEVLSPEHAIVLFLDYRDVPGLIDDLPNALRLFDKIFNIDTHYRPNVQKINDPMTRKNRLKFASEIDGLLVSGRDITEILVRLHSDDRMAFAKEHVERLNDFKSALEVFDALFHTSESNSLSHTITISKETAPDRLAIARLIKPLCKSHDDFEALKTRVHPRDHTTLITLLVAESSIELPAPEESTIKRLQ